MKELENTIQILEEQIERLKKLKEPDHYLDASHYMTKWLYKSDKHFLSGASDALRYNEMKFAEDYYNWRKEKEGLYSLGDILKAYPAPTPSPLYRELIENLTK